MESGLIVRAWLVSGAGISLTLAGNISPTERWAYDANAGWIDFTPAPGASVLVGDHVLSGYAYAANYGWIDFGNGAPANGVSYTNTGADRGVNLDATTGRLTGKAYAANIGWLDCNWAGSNDPNAPRVNPTNGLFSGYAFSENTGWILFHQLRATSLAFTDSDHDGMSDAWEKDIFGNLTLAGTGTDFDHDGQSDAAEFAAGTNPKDLASFLKVTSYTDTNGRVGTTLVFTSTPARLYQIQTSTDLVTWTPVTALGEFPGTAGATTTTVSYTHPTQPRFFHRVVVRPF